MWWESRFIVSSAPPPPHRRTKRLNFISSTHRFTPLLGLFSSLLILCMSLSHYPLTYSTPWLFIRRRRRLWTFLFSSGIADKIDEEMWNSQGLCVMRVASEWTRRKAREPMKWKENVDFSLEWKKGVGNGWWFLLLVVVGDKKAKTKTSVSMESQNVCREMVMTLCILLLLLGWLAGSLESITNLGRNNKVCFSIHPPIPMSFLGEWGRRRFVYFYLVGERNAMEFFKLSDSRN